MPEELGLAAKRLSANGRRSYVHTLGTVVEDLGSDLVLEELGSLEYLDEM